MIDRGIGIASIALTVIFGVLSLLNLQIPPWVLQLGLGIGIFLLGIFVGLVLYKRNNHKTVMVDNASCRLHIYPDYRVPDCLELKNIFRWFFLSYYLKGVNPKGKKTEIGFPTLYISFDPEVKVTNLKVSSPDMKLPPHEVKDFNQKYAIIAFFEKLNEGTLEIKVEP